MLKDMYECAHVVARILNLLYSRLATLCKLVGPASWSGLSCIDRELLEIGSAHLSVCAATASGNMLISGLSR